MDNESIKILEENGIQVVNGAVHPEDVALAVNVLHAHKVKDNSIVKSSCVDGVLQEMFERDAKLSIKALTFIKKTTGVNASYDHQLKEIVFYDPSFSVKADHVVNMIKDTFIAQGSSFNKETVEKIKSDKELESLFKEMQKLQKEAKPLKALTDKVYNGILEQMKEEGKEFFHRDGTPILDHSKLYMSDDDKLLQEYYKVSNDAICKEVPGTKPEYCPYLVNQDKIIKIKHKILDKIKEYHPEFKDKYISIENKDELIDINRKLFGISAAETEEAVAAEGEAYLIYSPNMGGYLDKAYNFKKNPLKAQIYTDLDMLRKFHAQVQERHSMTDDYKGFRDLEIHKIVCSTELVEKL